MTTLNEFINLVRASHHPRTLYLSERDFDVLAGKMNKLMSMGHDADGTYFTLITTRIRPKINVLDLSESKIFDD